MILMENGQKTVAVPMIGIISQLEELDFGEVRREIKTANPKISTPTVVAVLRGILEHIYYYPLQAVREQRLNEVGHAVFGYWSKLGWLTSRHRIQIETIRTTRRKTRRVKGNKPSAKETVIEEPC